MTGEGGRGGGGWGGAKSFDGEKALVLYKSVNTLCLGHLSKVYKMATFTRADG